MPNVKTLIVTLPLRHVLASYDGIHPGHQLVRPLWDDFASPQLVAEGGTAYNGVFLCTV